MQSSNMAEHSAHIVRVPSFLRIIRYVQLALSVIIIALMGYSMSQITYSLGSFGYAIFCCVYNFIAIGYLIFSSMNAPLLWNCWAALVLDIFGVIFWISAWGSLAAWAAVGNIAYDYSGGYSGYTGTYSGSSYYDEKNKSYERAYKEMYKKLYAAWQTTAAAAGLGAIVW